MMGYQSREGYKPLKKRSYPKKVRSSPFRKDNKSTFEEQRKTLLTSIKYCRKHGMDTSVSSLRWQLFELRRQRESRNKWKDRFL